MQILPLKFIHDMDKKIVGANLFNLARLNHYGLPVVESVIVIPPIDLIKKVVKRYSLHTNIAGNIGNLKRELLSLKVPQDLASIYLNFPSNKRDVRVDLEKLWQNLLEKWIYELVSKIQRQERIFLDFTPQQVIFSSNYSCVGYAFYDEDRGHVVVKVDEGKVDFELSQEIENLVLQGNKNLVIPQVYYWVVEKNKIKIIKLTPFTQSQLNEDKVGFVESITPKILKAKTATKIILNYTDEVINSMESDYVLMHVRKTGIEEISNKLSKISEFDHQPIIFYPEFENLGKNIREFAESFSFFKKKKNLNCQIVLPQTFSVDEFLNLKREFASLGIYSKGSLKIWKQFSQVSDFLNIEEYLDSGFDGAIIDLDKIVNVVIGVQPELFLSDPRIDWINSLEKFFEEFGFLKLLKNQKPVIVFGNALSCEEVLIFLIKSGIWGIAVSPNLIDSMREHISLLEKAISKNTKQPD